MLYLQGHGNIALGTNVRIMLSCSVEDTIETQCREDRKTNLREWSVQKASGIRSQVVGWHTQESNANLSSHPKAFWM